MRKIGGIIFLPLLFLLSCAEKKQGTIGENVFKGLQRDTSIRYASHFSFSENDRIVWVNVFGPKGEQDTIASVVLFKDSVPQNWSDKDHPAIKFPCKSIASLGSVYSNMICELGEGESIVAVENMDYYSVPELVERYKKGSLPELARQPEIDVEKCILIKPAMVISFGAEGPVSASVTRIRNAGIPVIVAADNLEESPLARAEWIKLIACFTGQRRKADSIFAGVEKKYLELKSLGANVASRPRVLTEIKYGELWYVPGGKSFAAQLMNDAGGDYVWKDNAQSGSLALGFEEVFVKAGKADVWLNPALVKSKSELKALESRYADFEAFRNGRIYNHLKHCNEKGYSDYWETGMIHPDRVLNDLLLIFHPELHAQLNKQYYYYKALE